MSQYMELTDIFNFNPDKDLIIGEIKKEQLPNSTFFTYRIPISARYPNGKIGPLIIPTLENLYSFGIQESRDPKSKELTGFSLSICLIGRQVESEEDKILRKKETEWTEKLEKIFDKISDNVVANKAKIKAFDLYKIKSPIFRKLDDDGNIVPDRSPVLYPKVLVKRPKGDKPTEPEELRKYEASWQITTPFDDMDNGEPIDPLTIIGSRLITQSAIKIESVFCGAKVTHQIKLHQSIVRVVEGGPKRLLSVKPKPAEKVTLETNFNPLANNDDDPPIKDDDEHDTEEVPKKVTKKVIRKKN